MLEYVYICRHGFRSNWVDASIKTGPTGMNRDPPLAAYGVEQAHRLADFLSDPERLKPYPVPERVISSPFYRCVQTAVPTYEALRRKGEAGKGVMLEHGVQEWYSTVIPDSGLHPRPGRAHQLSPLFPSALDQSYDPTLFPSRRGETVRELQDRADLFVEAWTGRMEATGVKAVIIFAHAASVIALGRAFTGDRSLEVSAGCASCSLYRRKRRRDSDAGDRKLPSTRSSTSLAAASTLLDLAKIPDGERNGETESAELCGVGEWDPVWLGRADYLEKGVERDWSFRDVVLIDGEVIQDSGDLDPHTVEDEIPSGLSPGMEKYLRRPWVGRSQQPSIRMKEEGGLVNGGAKM